MSHRFVVDRYIWEPGHPVLHAEDTADGRAVVTESALAEFVADNRANDPNGVWGSVHVAATGSRAGMLCMTSSDVADPDDWSYFPATGSSSASGDPLYVLDGWGLAPAPE